VIHCPSLLTEGDRMVNLSILNLLDIGPAAQRPGRSCSNTQIRST
jgi:hypothetical protein